MCHHDLAEAKYVPDYAISEGREQNFRAGNSAFS